MKDPKRNVFDKKEAFSLFGLQVISTGPIHICVMHDEFKTG